MESVSKICICYRHIFGCRGDLQDGLHQIDDQVLLYAAGHTVVLCNVETKAQRFIGGSQDTECISTAAVTPSRKHVAVAERAERGVVTVFDLQSLKRRKVLTSSETTARVSTRAAPSIHGFITRS